MIILVCVIAAFVGSYLVWYYRDGIFKLTRDFPGPTTFDAPLFEACVYGITVGEESNILCLVGANETGLYLTRPTGVKSTWTRGDWKKGHAVLLKAPIFIPWSALSYCRKSFLWKDCIRFDVPSNKSYFYIPLPDAEKLFRAAAKRLPDGAL